MFKNAFCLSVKLILIPLLVFASDNGKKKIQLRQDTHQYLVRQAYELLKFEHPEIIASDMHNHIGNSETAGPWTSQTIVAGAYREDEEKIVYGKKDNRVLTDYFSDFSIDILTTNYSQSYSVIDNKRTFYLSTGIGYKYHINKPDNNVDKAYNSSYAFTIDFALDFFGDQKNIFGLEFTGFPYVYGESPIYPKNFSIISNLYYKRNIPLNEKLSFQPSAGFTLFSNDAAQIFVPCLNIGISYGLEKYELFLKHSFRFAFPFMPARAPWLITAGYTLKI